MPEKDLTIKVGTQGTEDARAKIEGVGKSAGKAGEAFEAFGQKISIPQRAMFQLSNALYRVNPALGSLAYQLSLGTRFLGAVGVATAVATTALVLFTKSVNQAVKEQMEFNKFVTEGGTAARSAYAKASEAIMLFNRTQEEYRSRGFLGGMIAGIRGAFGGVAEQERTRMVAQMAIQMGHQNEMLGIQLGLEQSLQKIEQQRFALQSQIAATAGEAYTFKIKEVHAAYQALDAELKAAEHKANTERTKLYGKYMAGEIPLEVLIQEEAKLDATLTEVRARVEQGRNEQLAALRKFRIGQLFEESKQRIDEEKRANDLLLALSQDYINQRRAMIEADDMDEVTRAQQTTDLSVAEADRGLKSKLAVIKDEIAEKKSLLSIMQLDAQQRKQLEAEIAGLGLQRVQAERDYNQQILASRKQLRDQLKAVADEERQEGQTTMDFALQRLRARYPGYKGGFSMQMLQEELSRSQTEAQSITMGMQLGTVPITEQRLQFARQAAGVFGAQARTGTSPETAMHPALAGLADQISGRAPSRTPFGVMDPMVGELQNLQGTVSVELQTLQGIGRETVQRLADIHGVLSSLSLKSGDPQPAAGGGSGAESYRFGLKYTNAPSYYDWDVRSKEQEASRR